MPRINFQDACFVLSAQSHKQRPNDNLPEIVFVGRSNVGKSSLINSLCSSRLAFPSKSAGKTKTLNYFLIAKRFYLVDSPGYGYTAHGSREDAFFAKMMEPYFDNHALKGVVFLIDARRLLNKEDEEFLSFVEEKGRPLILVFTKCDQCKQSELSKVREYARKHPSIGVFLSAKGCDLSPLRSAIAKISQAG